MPDLIPVDGPVYFLFHQYARRRSYIVVRIADMFVDGRTPPMNLALLRPALADCLCAQYVSCENGRHAFYMD